MDLLRLAAEELYREPDGAPALEALRRIEHALRAIPPRRADDTELTRAWYEVDRARAALADRQPVKVRVAANRLYGTAVILLEPHRPWQLTHLMLLRFTLRDIHAAAEDGGALRVERVVLAARAACRALGLDPAVASCRCHGALERRLADAHAASGAAEAALLAEAARDALLLVDGLEVELAAQGTSKIGLDGANGDLGAARDGA
jgi:hypothetical protein